MSQKFITDIDLQGAYRVLGMLLETFAGNPGTTPLDSRIWYDSTNNTVKVRINGTTVDLRDRGAMTGSQQASTISDFTTAVRAIQWATMTAPSGAVNMNSQQFSSLAAASANGQAVEYQQFLTALQNIQVGMDFKEHADIAALANVSLSAPGATINGRTMQTGDRVLLTAQTTASQNGLWVWNGAAAAMTRPTDSPAGNNQAIVAGTVVEAYNATARQLYMQTATGTGTNAAIIVDTDAQTWANPFAAVTLTAGYGIAITGGTKVSFNPGTGMAATGADGAAAGIDTGVVSRKITGTIPQATGGIFTVGAASGGMVPVTINHGLNTVMPLFLMRYGSAGADPGNEVRCDNTASDANNLVVKVPVGYATNAYTFAISG